MKQKDKELLLRDLSARLPYQVFVQQECAKQHALLQAVDMYRCCVDIDFVGFYGEHSRFKVEYVKPYLRSISDMTSSEQKEYSELTRFNHHFAHELIDFYNSHHIDYRGLIDLELALKAPSDMYNFE